MFSNNNIIIQLAKFSFHLVEACTVLIDKLSFSVLRGVRGMCDLLRMRIV
jgi:hypothetical protein